MRSSFWRLHFDLNATTLDPLPRKTIRQRRRQLSQFCRDGPRCRMDNNNSGLVIGQRACFAKMRRCKTPVKNRQFVEQPCVRQDTAGAVGRF